MNIRKENKISDEFIRSMVITLEKFLKCDDGPLYHYTNMEALFSILSKKKLWLTRSDFMNDSSELNHINETFEEIKDQFIDTTGEENIETINNEKGKRPIINIIHDLFLQSTIRSNQDIFVLSLTSDADSLGLWSSYSPNAGCNITFSSVEDFIKILERDKHYEDMLILSGKVIYDNTLKRAILKEVVNSFLEMFYQVKYMPTEAKEILHKLTFVLHLHSAFFKDERFALENEFRIAFISDKTNSNVCFRTAHSTFIPYMEYDLPEPAAICLSPTNRSDFTQKGIENYLQFSGYTRTEVCHSKLPLRF